MNGGVNPTTIEASELWAVRLTERNSHPDNGLRMYRQIKSQNRMSGGVGSAITENYQEMPNLNAARLKTRKILLEGQSAHVIIEVYQLMERMCC